MYELERVKRQKRNRLCLGTYDTSSSNVIAWISAVAGVSAITLFGLLLTVLFTLWKNGLFAGIGRRYPRTEKELRPFRLFQPISHLLIFYLGIQKGFKPGLDADCHLKGHKGRYFKKKAIKRLP